MIKFRWNIGYSFVAVLIRVWLFAIYLGVVQKPCYSEMTLHYLRDFTRKTQSYFHSIFLLRIACHVLSLLCFSLSHLTQPDSFSNNITTESMPHTAFYGRGGCFNLRTRYWAKASSDWPGSRKSTGIL